MNSLLLALPLCIGLLASSSLQAQTNNTSTTPKKAEQKDGTHKSAHPFHGKLAAIDKTAKTITVGKSIYQITSETKMKKGDKPATLDDGVVGEETSGYARPTQDGKMYAATLHFGLKADAKATSKKKQ